MNHHFVLYLDEFKEAVKQANDTKQLHILIGDEEKPKVVNHVNYEIVLVLIIIA